MAAEFVERIAQRAFVAKVPVGRLLLLRFVHEDSHDGSRRHRAGQRRVVSDPQIPFVPNQLRG